ncbi:hypothetical protein OH809_38780 [Streptomyces sp. NBC_00873]|uniref:hypothetical protein n=1 Tax=unclassified Streptomyces TaxID=2593676 RepID=UPI00386B79F3|nr:hypothetical protein OH809_38780 [Streptomyces sp. NBC_00873]WTA42058.1 hypothetical protein OH821_04925 [Streptomyces sp. NBC_00842]
MDQDAYGLALRIAQARGWDCRPQGFGASQARLLVESEERWLGITLAPDDLVLLAAGHVVDGTPGNPEVETSATGSDLESLLAELDLLWQRLAGQKA